MKKIMLVDDSKITLKKMKRLFEELGYTVVLFANPLEAIEEFQNNSRHFQNICRDRTCACMSQKSEK